MIVAWIFFGIAVAGSAIFLGYEYYSLSKSKKEFDIAMQQFGDISVQIDQAQEDLLNLEDEIEKLSQEKDTNKTELNQLFQEKQNSKDEIVRLQENIESFRQSLKAIQLTTQEAQDTMTAITLTAFMQYCDTLDKDYSNKENEYDIKLNDLNSLINEAKAELDKVKKDRDVALASTLKEREVKEQVNFYKIQLTEEELSLAKALREIEYLFKDPRPVRMLIWETCYSKRVNELTSRVGANGACGIYKITSIESGLAYVGQCRDAKDRWRQHCKCGLGIDTPANSALYKLMLEEGIENFTFEILEKCTPSELNEREKFYIDLYQTYDFGLNGNKGISK